MNTLQTDIAIVTAILWLLAIAVIAYDRIKYRKYYASKSKLVVLRINNAAVRGSYHRMASSSASAPITTRTAISTP